MLDIACALCMHVIIFFFHNMHKQLQTLNDRFIEHQNGDIQVLCLQV